MSDQINTSRTIAGITLAGILLAGFAFTTNGSEKVHEMREGTVFAEARVQLREAGMTLPDPLSWEERTERQCSLDSLGTPGSLPGGHPGHQAVYTGTLQAIDFDNDNHGSMDVTVDASSGTITVDRTDVQGYSPSHPYGDIIETWIPAMNTWDAKDELDLKKWEREGSPVRWVDQVQDLDLDVEYPCYETLSSITTSVVVRDAETDRAVNYLGELQLTGWGEGNKRPGYVAFDPNIA